MADPAHDTTFVPCPIEPPKRFLHRFLDDEPHAALVHRVAVQVLVNEIVGTEPVEPPEPQSRFARWRSRSERRLWQLEHRRWAARSIQAERAQKNFWSALS
jgi:hypothetical protein